MNRETDHDYHLRRARSELDLAYRSDCQAALESHLRLSSLHMQRLSRPRGEAGAYNAGYSRKLSREVPRSLAGGQVRVQPVRNGRPSC